MAKIRVTVWNEYIDDLTKASVVEIYPQGIHGCIAEFLEEAGFEATKATLEMPEHGLTEEVLNRTDVLIWWGHKAHHLVEDEIVERVHQRILEGMGFIALHSSYASKIFRALSGTNVEDPKWRHAEEKSILWVVDPAHPIVDGLDEKIILDQEEMYGERFNIPLPEAIVFISWFEGGEVLRSGCCYTRGKGKVFYFQPGHEEYPVYYNKEIQKVICNAVKWAKPIHSPVITNGMAENPIMPIHSK